jgi:hypothetical protein
MSQRNEQVKRSFEQIGDGGAFHWRLRCWICYNSRRSHEKRLDIGVR